MKLFPILVALAMLCTPAFGQTAVSKTDVRDFVFEKWGAYNFEDSSGKRSLE